jgi:hypothetical protein
MYELLVQTRTAPTFCRIHGNGFLICTRFAFHTLAFTCANNFSTATSVEVERQFSVGRRAMSFMQHNMSHDVFRARMALGSWEGTPLFPDWSVAAHILEKHML